MTQLYTTTLLAPSRQTPHSSPSSLTDSLVGRAHELRVLRELFDGGARLVTLTGTAGVGKTRLAREWLPSDARFVDLSEAADLSEMEALLVAERHGPPRPRSAGASLTGMGRTIVVLDNFEHLVAHAEASVGRWLKVSDLRFLVTSRRRLRLPEEHVLSVEPLPTHSLDGCSLSAQLLMSRARQLRRSDSPESEELGELNRIGELLDGIPLALMLAAPRLVLLGGRELRRALTEELSLVDSAEGTLRTVINGTWALLDEVERSVLGQCMVFRGGFTFDAAKHVIDAGSERRVVDLVQSLFDKSLLRSTNRRRLSVHASVHELVMSKVDHQHDVRKRHCRYYGELAMRLAKQLDGDDAANAWRRLSRERDNVRQAADCELDRPNAQRATLALSAILASNGKRPSDERRVDGLLAAGGGDFRAELLLNRGTLHITTGRLDLALADLREAAQLANAEDLPKVEAKAYRMQATIDILRGHLDEATRLVERRGLPLCRARGERREEVRSLLLVAHARWTLGQRLSGMRLFEEALRQASSIGAIREEGLIRSSLGAAAAEKLCLDEALRHLVQAEAIHEELEDFSGAAYASVYRGVVHLARQEWAQARGALESARSMTRDSGLLRFEGCALGYLGVIAQLECSDHDKAYRRLNSAITILGDAEERRYEGLFAAFAGVSARILGRTRRAAELFCLAKKRIVGTGDAGMLEAIKLLETGEHHRLAELLSWREGELVGPPHRLCIDVLLAARARANAADSMAKENTEALIVDRAAGRFRPPGAMSFIDVSSRRALLGILWALIDAYGKDQQLTTIDLAQWGWPGEQIMPKAAGNRVRVAISTLRKLGLSDTIVRHHGGYEIHRRVPVVNVS